MPRLLQCLFLASGLVLTLADGTPQGQATPDVPVIEVAEHRAYVESLGTVSFEMLAIPGGTFWMGSLADERDRGDDEGPRHAVRIRPFWMGKTEVTLDEFQTYCRGQDRSKETLRNWAADAVADAVSRPSPTEVFFHNDASSGRHPVRSLTHYAAMQYCRWLSAKTGRTYRLPTEAEWEYACRAGTRSAYSFGNDAARLDDYAWHGKNSDDKPHEVGKKKPNAWGLCDMHGNVAEWCLDHYNKDWYAALPTDRPALWPVLLPTAKRYPHVTRGGSWADDPDRLRSAARRGSEKSWLSSGSVWWLNKWDVVGFRVVRPVEEQENLQGFSLMIPKSD